MTTPCTRVALVFLTLFATAAAAPSPLQTKVRTWRQSQERVIVDEFREFVAIPNTALDRANIRRNADFIVAMMQRRGIEARILTVPSGNANPYVYGEVKIPGATRTVMVYAHFDGQPVNPAQWAPGWEPFTPKFATAPHEQGGTLISTWKSGDPVDPQWRITGRGSADDKAGVMVTLNAYSALLASGEKPSVNLKFIFDGEEEIGSPNLDAIITAHRELLRADLWLILDSPCHASGRKTVAFGTRGDVNMHLTVFGPKRPLHSGNYGNWAPNPSQLLVNLLASMKDDEGRVLVAGFNDDVIPLSTAEQSAIVAIPSIESELKTELGLARTEVPGRTLFAGFTVPLLNINGIQGANAFPNAANVIPSIARATLDLRLVPGNDAQRQVAKVGAHIKARGWHVLDRDPTDDERARHPRLIRINTTKGLNPQRTPMDLPIARSVVAAVQSTVDYPIVQLPTIGGTLPLILVEEMLGGKCIIVPVVNADNNQHAENENVKVQFLWDGIETYAALMTMRVE